MSFQLDFLSMDNCQDKWVLEDPSEVRAKLEPWWGRIGEGESYTEREDSENKLAWLEEQNIHEAKDFLLLIFSWDQN